MRFACDVLRVPIRSCPEGYSTKMEKYGENRNIPKGPGYCFGDFIEKKWRWNNVVGLRPVPVRSAHPVHCSRCKEPNHARAGVAVYKALSRHARPQSAVRVDRQDLAGIIRPGLFKRQRFGRKRQVRPH